jgi:hypothetical protein
MLVIHAKGLVALVVLTNVIAIEDAWAQKLENDFRPVIPQTWDDAAMATLEVPLANPIGSPKHVPADYYYKIPVRPIYKSYPVYAPGHEPSGYIDWLKRQEPRMIWDDKGHAPPLKTEADWIKAGELVFDAPLHYDGILRVSQVRSPEWWAKVGPRAAKDGTLPGTVTSSRRKGR